MSQFSFEELFTLAQLEQLALVREALLAEPKLLEPAPVSAEEE